MADYYPADIKGKNVIIGKKKIEKKKAMQRIRNGDNVYMNKSNAKTLSIALSQGDPKAWKDGAHVKGGYKHFHDSTHIYTGHIFYGDPL